MTGMRMPTFVVFALTSIAVLLSSCREDPTRRQRIRELLFEEVQPVALENCTLERFGEANDGGYLVCGNLLSEVKAGYSYGISGYDGWGCEVSRRLLFAVHQYDCFDTRLPQCPTGEQMFHPECIAGAPKKEDGRIFATLQQQIAANRDEAKRLVVKMDVEGAEWESLEATPLNVLDRIDQLAIEFHGVDEEQYLRVVRTLKGLFYVAHLHYNNFRCRPHFLPFPADVFEVLFVNKRLGRLAASARPILPHPQDAPNNPNAPDCQPSDR
jgi:hypothetical protein